MLHLKVITPKKTVIDEKILSATVPTVDGEITILPRHTTLFSIIKEGILKIKTSEGEDYLAVGGGYVETDGENLTVLVSRAYGQDEIDENIIRQAEEEARKILSHPTSEKEKAEATTMMRRAIIDSKLLKKRKHKPL